MSIKTYLLLKEQSGGCDYTIGCGKNWEFITLDTSKQSIQDYILKQLEEEYGEMETVADRLEEYGLFYEVFEINETDFDFDQMMVDLKDESNLSKSLREKSKDEQEFNRLKKKLGK